METGALLAAITAAGLTIAAEGGALVVRPKARITPELRAVIRAHKAELLALLSDPSPTAMPPLDLSGHWTPDPEERAALRGSARGPLVHDVAGREEWARWWNDRVNARLDRGLTWAEAEARTWGEAQCLWHEHYADAPEPGRCAGCGERIGSPADMIRLGDGADLHVGGAYGFSCVARYGHSWRARATAGLLNMGLAMRCQRGHRTRRDAP